MPNIFDYLEWRGDLSFEQAEFNEVDNLILSILSYMDLDGMVPGEGRREYVTISDLAKHFKQPELPDNPLSDQFYELTPKLIELAAHTMRFKDMRLWGYVNQVDFERTEQFSAMVCSLTSRQHFVVFSGTDDTLVGWKENLQMSFMDEVRAQREAVLYTDRVMSDTLGKVYLGGHSKGGNLAVYAGAKVNRWRQNRIECIYNNDGPGFQPAFLESEGYRRVLDKINTFLPRSSVVGMLLEHKEGYKVVASSETFIMQHDPFSWEVKGSRFVYEEGLSESSKEINRTLKAWLERIPMQERQEFIDALFDILKATGAKTLSELNQEKHSAAISVIKTYTHLEAETQNLLKTVLESFFTEGNKFVMSRLGKGISNLIAKTLPGKKHENQPEQEG